MREQRFDARRTRAAHHAAFFNCDQRVVGLRQLDDERLIQRFDKAHIRHAGIELLGRDQTLRDHRAKCKNRNPLAARLRGFAPHLAAVLSICQHSFSSEAAITVRLGMQRRKARSYAPICVAPSAPTTPARSIANTTGSFCSAISWISWS